MTKKETLAKKISKYKTKLTKLQEELTNIENDNEHHGNEYSTDIQNKLENWAKSFTDIKQKETNNGNSKTWIPVTQALPETDEIVAVTAVTKKGIKSWNRAYYDGTTWHGSGSMAGVTAWMKITPY